MAWGGCCLGEGARGVFPGPRLAWSPHRALSPQLLWQGRRIKVPGLSSVSVGSVLSQSL